MRPPPPNLKSWIRPWISPTTTKKDTANIISGVLLKGGNGMKRNVQIAWIFTNLKNLSPELTPFPTLIFQKTIDEGEVPSDWKYANVTALFKKGDRFKTSNYGPLSLTCLCCNLQEHLFTTNLLKHLEKYNILTDCQHGFRARRSCETQLLTLTHHLASSLDSGIQQDLVIIWNRHGHECSGIWKLSGNFIKKCRDFLGRDILGTTFF